MSEVRLAVDRSDRLRVSKRGVIGEGRPSTGMQITVRVPAKAVAEIDAVVGPGRRARFIRSAIAARLRDLSTERERTQGDPMSTKDPEIRSHVGLLDGWDDACAAIDENQEKEEPK